MKWVPNQIRNFMNRIFKALPILLILLSCNSENRRSKVLYSNSEYTLYSNKVVQGENEAFVISADSITSDYLSPLSKDSARSKKLRAKPRYVIGSFLYIRSACSRRSV